MKKIIGLIIAVAFIGIGCKSTSKSSMVEVINNEGEVFTAKNVVSYDGLLTKLETKQSIDDVIVEGKVAAVCQAKGCWMNIVSDKDVNAPQMFVKFQDYGFFMPLDLSGGRVIMKGKAYKEVTSVEELRHYAEDEGKTKAEIAAITKPKEELKFMAKGVQILK